MLLNAASTEETSGVFFLFDPSLDTIPEVS